MVIYHSIILSSAIVSICYVLIRFAQTKNEKCGIDETEDSSSSSQSDTEVSLSSGDSTTPSCPVTPEAVNSPQLGQLQPNNVIAGEAIAVNHDRLVLPGNRGMPYDPQFLVASNAIRLPAVPSRSVVQDRVGQYTYDQDEAEVQSDPSGSLSSDDSKTQSRTFFPQAANSPQLYQLHSNNLMTVEANTGVNHGEPGWGMPVDSQQSSAVHTGSAMQDPVGQMHQGMAWDVYNTDEEENSSSLSQCDTDASLSSHDSSAGAQPVVPQAANSPSPLVTDHHLDANNPVADQADAPGQAFGNQPSENDDETQHMNIQQVYPLQFEDIAHLIQKLRKKCTKLEACKQDLQYCRQQCAQLQATINEYERLLDGSNHLQQENQHLIRMTEEMCELKDQEIQQLRQLCEQKDQDVETLSAQNESLRGEYIQVLHELDRRNNSFQQQMESIMRERQELSEVVEQSQRELYAERESLWLGDDRLLDQRMTDEVKILQQELDEQKRKKTEAEERSRCLFEENCQLNAMVKELMSRPAELAEVSCNALSPDTVQENLVSSSNDSTVGEADEESDEDEEVFEDALDHFLKGADLERKF